MLNVFMKGQGTFIGHVPVAAQTRGEDFPGAVVAWALGAFEVRETPALCTPAAAPKGQDSRGTVFEEGEDPGRTCRAGGRPSQNCVGTDTTTREGKAEGRGGESPRQHRQERGETFIKGREKGLVCKGSHRAKQTLRLTADAQRSGLGQRTMHGFMFVDQV